jgi:alanine dehydrogenase
MYLKKETKDGETISDYESSGAKIVDKFSAFQSDIVLKVRSPTMNEVGLFREQVSF